ncbi:MAG: ribosome recycling factor [bacterium]|nr:ribosome recycling factor [bacterium]
MVYSFSQFNTKAKENLEWLSKELSSLRSGRAAPQILDGVQVELYGTKMPIRHAANISIEDVRTLRVTPFDMGAQKDIEKAIASSNLGLSVAADERGVRAHFPELTSERRDAIIKTGKELLERSRVQLRRLRDEAMKEIEQKEKEGGMGEDERFRLKKEMDKLSDAENKKLQDAFERKEKEISS